MVSQDKVRTFFKKFVSIKYILFYIVFIVLLTVILYFLTPIKQYLDSEKLSFSIGSVRFSIYSLITSIVSLIFLTGTVLWVLKFGEQKIRSITKIKASNREILVKGFYILICTSAFLVVLSILGIDLTALAVFGSAIGIGIGLGLQKIASNFISGIALLFEKPFEIGDLIELNDHTLGFVRQIAARFVLVETFCGKEIMVPNEEFMAHRIINWTHHSASRRLEVNIEVSYTEKISEVKDVILDVAKNHPICLSIPEPFCLLQDVKDGAIFFSLRFWVEDVKQGFLVPESKVRMAIWERLQKEGIKISIPYRVLLKEKG